MLFRSYHIYDNIIDLKNKSFIDIYCGTYLKPVRDILVAGSLNRQLRWTYIVVTMCRFLSTLLSLFVLRLLESCNPFRIQFPLDHTPIPICSDLTFCLVPVVTLPPTTLCNDDSIDIFFGYLPKYG